MEEAWGESEGEDMNMNEPEAEALKEEEPRVEEDGDKAEGEEPDEPPPPPPVPEEPEAEPDPELQPRKLSESEPQPRKLSESELQPRKVSESEAQPRKVSESGEPQPRKVSESEEPQPRKVSEFEPRSGRNSLGEAPTVGFVLDDGIIAQEQKGVEGPVRNSSLTEAQAQGQGRSLSLMGQREDAPKSVASIFPSTHASLRGRGSDVGDDMLDLMSFAITPQSRMSVFLPASAIPTPGGNYRTSRGMDDIRKGLETEDLLKVEEWLRLDTFGEYLGKRKHFLRIINTMDYDEKLLEVCNFMTVNDVMCTYAEYNSNCREYVWKDIEGNGLHCHKSLGENGLVDRSLFTDETGLDHFPTILLYFKDGFENEPPMKLDISSRPPEDGNLLCRNY